MRIRGYFIASTLAAVAAFACGKTYGTASNDADGGLVDAATADALPLACPAGCLSPTPAGWTGPSAIYQGPPDSGPAACPLTYPSRESDSFVADAGTAGCACNTTSQHPLSLMYRLYSGDTCPDPNSYILGNHIDFGACTLLPTAGPNFNILDDNDSGIACCSTPTQDPLPLLDETAVTSCAVRSETACIGRPDCTAVLTPESPFARVCIHADGDVPCPTTDYPNRFVSYRNVSDTRACTACAANLSGGACTSFALFADGGCGGIATAADLPIDGGCVPATGIGSFILTTGSGTCQVSGGARIGSIALDGPVTYCCAN